MTNSDASAQAAVLGGASESLLKTSVSIRSSLNSYVLSHLNPFEMLVSIELSLPTHSVSIASIRDATD